MTNEYDELSAGDNDRILALLEERDELRERLLAAESEARVCREDSTINAARAELAEVRLADAKDGVESAERARMQTVEGQTKMLEDERARRIHAEAALRLTMRTGHGCHCSLCKVTAAMHFTEYPSR